MAAAFSLRPAVPADGPFLAEMVVEAANWHAARARPKVSVLSDPAHVHYVSGWMRPGDVGVVAEDDEGEAIGAAWYRIFTKDDAAHGYVATGVPELIIGVRPLWRGMGVGRALMRELVRLAGASGYARLALSVERGNFAESLYRSEGFRVAEERPTRVTMIRRLA
ncbi:GNAT family N-acetyltransferase [Agromyces sp. SYSU T00194]|uniref:GNAT family N-acetyltransferase n=1 Tax=Agromyces chitinivorans TaxID=3158560 RepID=UPI00339B04D4